MWQRAIALWLHHLPHPCKKWGCAGLAQGWRQPWDIIIGEVDLEDLFANGETVTHSLFLHIRQSLTKTLQARDLVQDIKRVTAGCLILITEQVAEQAGYIYSGNGFQGQILCHQAHGWFVKLQFSSSGISRVKNSQYINPHHRWSRGLCHNLQWPFHNDRIFTLDPKRNAHLTHFIHS